LSCCLPSKKGKTPGKEKGKTVAQQEVAPNDTSIVVDGGSHQVAPCLPKKRKNTRKGKRKNRCAARGCHGRFQHCHCHRQSSSCCQPVKTKKTPGKRPKERPLCSKRLPRPLPALLLLSAVIKLLPASNNKKTPGKSKRRVAMAVSSVVIIVGSRQVAACLPKKEKYQERKKEKPLHSKRLPRMLPALSSSSAVVELLPACKKQGKGQTRDRCTAKGLPWLFPPLSSLLAVSELLPACKNKKHQEKTKGETIAQQRGCHSHYQHCRCCWQSSICCLPVKTKQKTRNRQQKRPLHSKGVAMANTLGVILIGCRQVAACL